MKVWIFILKAFGYAWITISMLLILASIVTLWLNEGFSAVQELLSPFNVINFIVTVVTLAPGVGAIALAAKLKERENIS